GAGREKVGTGKKGTTGDQGQGRAYRAQDRWQNRPGRKIRVTQDRGAQEGGSPQSGGTGQNGRGTSGRHPRGRGKGGEARGNQGGGRGGTPDQGRGSSATRGTRGTRGSGQGSGHHQDPIPKTKRAQGHRGQDRPFPVQQAQEEKRGTPENRGRGRLGPQKTEKAHRQERWRPCRGQ